MKQIITQFDYMSIKPQLSLSSHSPIAKNYFGGIITLILGSCMIFAIAYFFLEFINKTHLSIIVQNNLAFRPSINHRLEDMPLMIRIIDQSKNIISLDESIMKIRMQYVISNYDNKTTVAEQQINTFDLEPCKLSKHFTDWKEIMQNVSNDLESFLCPIYTMGNMTLEGLYGDPSNWSILNFSIYKCKHSNSTSCKDTGFIDSVLTDAYLELRMLNYQIKPYEEIPYELVLSQIRIPISQTIFQRIWINLMSVNYESDNGWIFQNIQDWKFYQVEDHMKDIDLRDYENVSFDPGAFVWVTIKNSKDTMNIQRDYMKFQDFLANTGGIVKGILLIGTIITNMYSTKVSYEKLISASPDILSLRKVNKSKAIRVIFPNNNNNLAEVSLKKSPNINNLIALNRSGLEENESQRNLKESKKIKPKDSDLNQSINSVKYPNQLEALNIEGLNKNLDFKSFGTPENKQIIDSIDPEKIVRRSKLHKSTIGLTNCERFLPSWATSKSTRKEFFEFGVKEIDLKLNMINIIWKLFELECLKYYLLDDYQYKIFTFLYSDPSRNLISEQSFKIAVDDLLSKTNKTDLDNKLVEELRIYS